MNLIETAKYRFEAQNIIRRHYNQFLPNLSILNERIIIYIHE